MMARVRVENQPSSDRENVVVAATARRMAGSAAMTLNSKTIRVCSRAPGTCCFQARRKPSDCQTMMASMAWIKTTLTASAVQTISLRGAIPVRPVRIK